MGSGTLVPVDVPADDSVVGALVPAIDAALGGGAPVVPLPSSPAPLRKQLAAELRPDLPPETADIAAILPTSGATGVPKGVLLSATAIAASARATEKRLGGPGSWLLALPATHVAGFMVLARSVIAGTTPRAIDLSAGFDPAQFAAGSADLATTSAQRRYTSLVARQLALIVDAGGAALDALAGYDAVLVGGSAIPPELVDKATEAGANVVRTYGMTETCGGCVYDGVPLDNVRVDLTDDDVVRITGPVLASGYRGRPDLTQMAFGDGWFRTADLGRVSPEGHLTVLGRSDDVAISGGVNVPLVAVDQAVGSHPQVQDAVAVALPDDQWGQRVVVLVVPADPNQPPSLRSIRSHVKTQAPSAYAPQEVVVTETLPTTPSGKVDRRAAARIV